VKIHLTAFSLIKTEHMLDLFKKSIGVNVTINCQDATTGKPMIAIIQRIQHGTPKKIEQLFRQLEKFEVPMTAIRDGSQAGFNNIKAFGIHAKNPETHLPIACIAAVQATLAEIDAIANFFKQKRYSEQHARSFNLLAH